LPPSFWSLWRVVAPNRNGVPHNMTVVASFGAARHLSFANNNTNTGRNHNNNKSSRSSAAAAAAVAVVATNLALANNTVAAVGRGVFFAPPSGGGGWQYMVKNAKPCERSNHNAVEDDSIIVLIHGRCTRMEQPPGSSGVGRGGRPPAKRPRGNNEGSC
jgi:hypothetical protein